MGEESYQKSINKWINALTTEEKAEFKSIHLDGLFCLKQIRVDYNFLRAACGFWDPQQHVFCFGKNEICPMPDEFSAILGFPTATHPAVPRLSTSFVTSYERLLGLTSVEAKDMVDGRAVNMLKIVQKFRDPVTNLTEKRHRRRALCLCLLNLFLFVDGGGDMGDASLIHVVEQIDADCSPVPMILVETLTCVDLVRADANQCFFGSPVLLQVCFYCYFSIRFFSNA